ncbi:response regulator transcription factor [Croceibacterium sp. LX-88]|jgi:two-component system nitrate/nitrite response regulator NarL|uniref:Response regulator transcription factor n=1 Tax=Croceibacterium selenioxidans TaxID=2838833 RepID=A0ABS5W3Y4_9SPHN|nr:response regulator transcription factor [Croceibacterium selenioxidans]MBT2134032.1 response regulator transcription factor [Croceibacterium selenioxidans]
MQELKNISISLICSTSLVSEGLRRILDEREFTVEGSFKSSHALLGDGGEILFATKSELILLDVSAATELRDEVVALRKAFPKSRLVLLSDTFELDSMIEAVRAGADGYILKEIACECLLESLKLVAMGEKVLPGQLIEHLPHGSMIANSHNKVEADLASLLSEREIETLRCLIMGYPNKVIAYRLDISEATVKVHVKAILRKLMVQNRTQAAIWAVNHGLDANAVCATIAAAPSSARRAVEVAKSDSLIAIAS